ncbi:MAG: helix-turn-helix transcriptional regulator [Clostridia bacterium]|nr:helix-turn-helix transcriptional regulator [Clostridia bacterium]
MKIGEKIRRLRQSKGITQKELAGMLYVSTQAVSKWETGKSTPNIQILPLIAELFGVSVSYFFTD